MRTVLPLTVLVTAMCLCTVDGFYEGKRAADRWYKARNGDIFVRWSGKTSGHIETLDNSGQVYWSKSFADDEQYATVRVRWLSSIPRVCSIPGDAFVLRANGHLFVCSEKRWVTATPPVYERDGKE